MLNIKNQRRARIGLIIGMAVTLPLQAQDQPIPELESSRIPIRFFTESPIGWDESNERQFPALPSLPEELLSINQQDADIEDYKEAISNAENTGGAWDVSLIEELMSLGSVYHHAGNHVEAAAVYERALHLYRINYGLDNLLQLEPLGNLIESYDALSNWEEVDRLREYRFHLELSGYDQGDIRKIAAIEEQADWRLHAFNLGIGEKEALHLLKAQTLYDAAAWLIELESLPAEQERYRRLKLGVAKTALLATRHQGKVAALEAVDVRVTQQSLLAQLGVTSERIGGFKRAYQTGFRALSSLVMLSQQQADAPALISSLLDLADWQVMFRKYDGATLLYLDAWELMQQDPINHQYMDESFGQLVRIPTFIEYGEDQAHSVLKNITANDRDSLQSDVASISFDVTSRGTARNIQVHTEETAHNSDHLEKLARSVRFTFYRPALVDGKLTASKGHRFVYRYWY